MNAETKRHIDAARQVLVGVVPNPTAQIDQITNALIYKFMDDMDQAAIKAGGKPSFFVGDLERYAWTRLMDTRMGNQDRMNLYSEALLKFSQAKQLPELFRGIFKSAFLPYRSPETLGLFLKEIDFFDYSHPEELGNAYEYLLSIMSSQGDAGQFRTPRHIIDFIVAVVNPTKDDKVLDPACGTGGFLVSSYRHILEQHTNKKDTKKKAKTLTPDDRKRLMNNFEGYDVSPEMVRLSRVNMYLHQFKNPQIFEYNTLSQDERWKDKFDVILANPPFMSPKGGVKTHTKFSVQSSRSEVLFVDYIMNHLRPKGRAGIIVPEGIIFQSGLAHKQLRKNLVEDGLYAVVSLPSGVFAPYSGVKTSILLFNNELAKKSEEIIFVKIESDGFDLGSQRRMNIKNDLPTALEILGKWNKGEKVENKLVVYVEKNRIAEGGDYNLSGDRYRVAVDYTNAKWPILNLGEVCDIFNGSTPRRTEEQYWENGLIPWFTIDDIRKQGAIIYSTQQKITEKGLKDSSVKLLPKHSTLLCCTASIGECAYTEIELTTNQQFNGLVINKKYKDKVNPKYIFWISTTFKNELVRMSGKATFGFVSVGNLKKFKIPLPPLEIQGQIVAELDAYQNIISGARQIVKNWKPRIEVEGEWERVRLGNNKVIQIIDGDRGTNYPSKDEFKQEGYCLFLNTGNVRKGEFDFSKCDFITQEKDSKLRKGKLIREDVILTTRGTLGNTAYFSGNTPYENIRINSGMVIFRSCIDKIFPNFLLIFLNSSEFASQVTNFMSGSAQPQLPIRVLNEIEIPLPPLAIQKQIVEKIEAERVLVESAKKLVGVYEGKIKEVVEKLWNE